MPSDFEQFDPKRIRTHSVLSRERKVEMDAAATPWIPGGTAKSFIDSLPDILAGKDLKTTITAISSAAAEGRPVILMMGAHVIKCGLSPIIADLISRGIITALALNGAGAIHDTEMALFGRTSEDVIAGLRDGSFGMGAETANLVNGAVVAGCAEGRGFGEAIGRSLIENNAPHSDISLLATATRAGIPATVHVAMGTDIVHMHPDADGAAIGGCTMRDFRIFTAQIEDLAVRGGVLINAGSAVILPEVALKAFAMVSNVGLDLSKLFAVNLDFIRQYRSEQQIIQRAKSLGGQAVSIVGHHEILLPLIAAGVKESGQGPGAGGQGPVTGM